MTQARESRATWARLVSTWRKEQVCVQGRSPLKTSRNQLRTITQSLTLRPRRSLREPLVE